MSPSQPDEASLVLDDAVAVPVAWALLRDESSLRCCLREGNGRIELIGSLAPRAR
jgi:hypothetical protein